MEAPVDAASEGPSSATSWATATVDGCVGVFDRRLGAAARAHAARTHAEVGLLGLFCWALDAYANRLECYTIEIEKQITFAYGAKFKDRGPPAPSEGGPEQWRHQKWRESGNRWGNRGGKNKHVWTAFFAGKAKGEKAEGKMGVKAEGKKGDKAEGRKGDGKGAADKAGDDLEGADKSGGGGMDDGSGGGWGSPNASS